MRMKLLILVAKHFYKKIRLWVFKLFKIHVHSTGPCNVCGRTSDFYQRKNLNLANTLECGNCCSISRYRLIALMLANYLNGRDIRSLDMSLSLSQVKIDSNITIYDTSYLSPIYRGIKNKDAIIMSEYLPHRKKMTKNFYSEDLQNLSFPSGSFDYVISSEVFEHVLDPWKGFSEVNRVLKMGGYHIFTVPYDENSSTVKRAEKGQNDIVNYLLPPRYHKDPLSLSGSLVVTEYGSDFIERLEALGFTTVVYRTSHGDKIFGGAFTFISKKVSENI